MNSPRRIITHGLVALTLISIASCASTSSIDGAPISLFKKESDKDVYLARYAAVLEQWPLPFEEVDLTTRFGKTHVIVNGRKDAPPLVLLHAFSTSATVWRPNIAALSEHFRTYAVDILGEPNKSEPTRALKSSEDFANWMTDVLDGLHIEQANLVGNSFGGAIALNQVVFTPKRVARVVLISPAVFPMSWRFYYYAGMGVGLGIKSYRDRLDTWMANGVPLDPANSRWAALFAATNTKPVNSLAIRISDSEWQTIDKPTLLLVGEKEVVYSHSPKEVLEHAQQLMPALLVDIVPNANHVAAMSNPKFVDERVIRFLLTDR